MRSASLLPLPFTWRSAVMVLSTTALGVGLLSGCSEDHFAEATAATTHGTRSAQTVIVRAKPQEPLSRLGKYGGSITDTAISDPKTFNQFVSADAGSGAAIAPISNSLIAQNPYTLKYEMRLAESEKVSPDGLTWTYRLRPSLKWSDGHPLTADDVIFTLDADYNPKVQFNGREGMLLDKPDGKGGFTREPLKYRKVDERTVEFKFPVQYAPARSILSFGIGPKHKLEKSYRDGLPKDTKLNSTWGVNTAVKDIVSCGPWVLSEYVQGQRLAYTRNPYYYKKDAAGRPLPYLDKYVTLIVPDLNATTLKFRAGECDTLGVPLSDYPSMKKGEDAGNYKLLDVGPSWGNLFLSLNENPKSLVAKQSPWLIKLFRDARFRQALSCGINRARLARVVYNGLADPMYGPESPANTLFFNPKLPKFPYNRERARALLKSIGLKDSDGDGFLEFEGKPVSFNILTNVENNQRKTTATIITDDLRRIGLDVTFTPMAFNSLIGRLNGKPEPGKYPPYDWEAIILGFTGGSEPNGGRNIWNSSGNLHQWYPYQEKPATPWETEIDTIFRQGAQEMNPARRKALYQKFQAIAAKQLPLIYTVVPDAVIALRNGFGNVKPCSLGGVTWNRDELYSLKATRDKP